MKKILNHNFFTKKTQIGVFILISLIIVIIGISVFTYNSDNIKLFDDQTSSYKVKSFVVSCMNLETKQAIKELALHGGWLYSPFSENSDFLYADKDTNSYLVKNKKGYKDPGGITIPYWYYYDDSDETFKFNIPDYDSDSKYSIKNQLKRYLDEKFDKECIKGFEDFKDIYTVEYDKKNIDFKVEFDDDQMYINLELPLKINELNSNNSEYLTNFGVKKENDLWTAYALAKDITISEKNTSFIEKRTLSFMAPYETSNRRDLLPPTYDYQLKYDFKPWKVKNVEKVFRQILSSNIHNIKFLNSADKPNKLPNDKLKDSKFAKALNNLYYKDYLSENSIVKKSNSKLFDSYKSYKVSTKYEYFFPTYFNIAPSLGNILLLPRPESVINLIPIFFTEYVAVYSIVNPVVFEISKKTGNEVFLFNLAIESNIDYNAPLADKKNFAALSKATKSIKPKKTLICDPSQRISDWVTINITDPVQFGKRRYELNQDDLKDYETRGLTGIDGATVSFDCKGLSSCYIGSTKINAHNQKGNFTQLKFRLPINCNPGTLKISKWDYQTLTFKNLDPKLSGQINLGAQYMPSKKTFKLKIGLKDPKASLDINDKSLKDGMSAFIIFENKIDTDFVQVVDVKSKNQYDLNVTLIPGIYKVTSVLMTNKSLHIPSKSLCTKKKIIGGGCSKTTTIPAIDMNTWILGGLQLDNFNVTINDLTKENTLKLTLLSFTKPSTFDELSSTSQEMSKLKDYSKSYHPHFTRE